MVAIVVHAVDSLDAVSIGVLGDGPTRVGVASEAREVLAGPQNAVRQGLGAPVGMDVHDLFSEVGVARGGRDEQHQLESADRLENILDRGLVYTKTSVRRSTSR
jgi:hypothetical protein